MYNKFNGIISINIILILILAVLFSGCIGIPTVKADYRTSSYHLYLYGTNIKPIRINISIPFPTGINQLENFQAYEKISNKKNITLKVSPYGYTIHIDIDFNNEHKEFGQHFIWYPESYLIKEPFSTQNASKIWINFINMNNSETIYFTLWKEDEWYTNEFLTTIIEYSGVMKNQFPNYCGGYSDYMSTMKSNTVELMEGWNQYSLTTGTYDFYDD